MKANAWGLPAYLTGAGIVELSLGSIKNHIFPKFNGTLPVFIYKENMYNKLQRTIRIFSSPYAPIVVRRA